MGVNDVSQLRPGDVIGGEYHIKQVFGGEGQSGMGVVYLVEDRGAPFPFVLKSIQLGKDEKLKELFLKEAKIWVDIGHHPNVVKALWVREIDDSLFVAAEFINPDENGRNTVQDYLKIMASSPITILRWACQFCDGMEYAQHKGLRAHRDIKPENLMVDAAGNLKITDFGLAKVQESLLASSTSLPAVKGASGIAGTPPYMAPEQFADPGGVDYRSDIYAFGIVLYNLAARGKYPYEIPKPSHNPIISWAQVHLKSAPTSLEGPFKKIVERCLQKKPSKRYSSFKDLRKDLSKVAKKLQLAIPPVASVESNDNEELFMQAQSYVDLGDKGKALELITRYIECSPDNYWGWTEKGKILLQLKDYEASIKATEKSLEIYNGNSHPWNNLGIALNRLNRTVEAINAYENALLIDPENNGAMMNACDPLIKEARFNDASRLLIKALKLSPTKKTLHFNAGNAAVRMMEEGSVDHAIPLLEELVLVDNESPQHWQNLALLYQSKREVEKAIICFGRVLGLEPENAFVLLSLARLNADCGNFELAIDYCDKLIGNKSELGTAITLKAQLLVHIGRPGEGISMLQQVLQSNPMNDTLWFILSEIQFSQGNYNGAFGSLVRSKNILTSGSNPPNKDNLLMIEERLKLVGEKIKRGQHN